MGPSRRPRSLPDSWTRQRRHKRPAPDWPVRKRTRPHTRPERRCAFSWCHLLATASAEVSPVGCATSKPELQISSRGKDRSGRVCPAGQDLLLPEAKWQRIEPICAGSTPFVLIASESLRRVISVVFPIHASPRVGVATVKGRCGTMWGTVRVRLSVCCFDPGYPCGTHQHERGRTCG